MNEVKAYNMKKIFLLIFGIAVYTSVWSIELKANKNVKNHELKSSIGDDAGELSMIRMQNKVIAGIELSLNPSWTNGDFISHTLASFRIGYRLKQNVLTGSLGVEFAVEEMFMPFTIDYKYYLKYKDVWSPYVYAQTGYSWHLKRNINSRSYTSNYSQYDPGALASIGFGYSYTTNLNEFYFSLGYSYRSLVEVKPTNNNQFESIDKTMNGIAFNIGINF